MKFKCEFCMIQMYFFFKSANLRYNRPIWNAACQPKKMLVTRFHFDLLYLELSLLRLDIRAVKLSANNTTYSCITWWQQMSNKRLERSSRPSHGPTATCHALSFGLRILLSRHLYEITMYGKSAVLSFRGDIHSRNPWAQISARLVMLQKIINSLCVSTSVRGMFNCRSPMPHACHLRFGLTQLFLRWSPPCGMYRPTPLSPKNRRSRLLFIARRSLWLHS